MSEMKTDREYTESTLSWAPKGPGEYIRCDILQEKHITQSQLAALLGVERRTVSELVNGHRAVSTEMALRLSHLTGTSPELWLNLQTRLDLWHAKREKVWVKDQVTPL